MAKFNLAETLALKPVSKLDTKAELIDLALIDPHPDNFFMVEENITELAESIALHGLLQPLVITPIEGGRYRLIAGHRRRKALLRLSESEPEKYRFVSCTVQPPMSPELEMLALIHTNTEAREIDSITRAKAAQAAEAALVKLVKEQGVELPGKMRAHIAKIIKSSEAQIARANYIANHVIDPLLVSGISDNALYKLAHLPEEQQRELYEHYKNFLPAITVQNITKYAENVAAGLDPFPQLASIPNGRDCLVLPKLKGGKYQKCSHGDIIKFHKSRTANLRPTDAGSVCHGGCCQFCRRRFQCIDVCPHLKAEISKIQSAENYIYNSRLRSARLVAGISDEREMLRANCTISELLLIESTQQLTASRLADCCRVYGCTPNQILGFDNKSGGGDDP